MKNKNIGDTNCGKLFAENYLEGVNRHAQKISFDVTNQVDAFEHCRHIGVALEMFIYASIAWNDPLKLFNTRKNAVEEQETTAILRDLVHGLPNVRSLSRLQVAPVNTLLPIVVEELTGTRNTQSGVGMFMQQLIQARNDVVHRNVLPNSAEYITMRFVFFKDSVCRRFGKDDPRFLALDGRLPSNKPAFSRLLEQQITNLRTHYVPLDTSELHNRYSSKIGIIKSDANSYAKYAHGVHRTEIVICPVCSYPSFLQQRTTHMATAWMGEPDNSASLLATFSNYSDKNELTLVCAVCNLAWNEVELAYYAPISELEPLIPEFDSCQIKTKKTAILDLADKHQQEDKKSIRP